MAASRRTTVSGFTVWPGARQRISEKREPWWQARIVSMAVLYLPPQLLGARGRRLHPRAGRSPPPRSGSLDHLVGSQEERRWDRESERLRRPVVDDQLEPRRLLEWQLTRPRASQDLCDLLSRDRIDLVLGCAVGHETTSVYEEAEGMHRGQVGLEREVAKLSRPRIRAQDHVGIHEQGVRPLLRDDRQLRKQLVGGSYRSLLQLDPQTRGDLLGHLPRVGSSFRVMKKHHARGLRNRPPSYSLSWHGLRACGPLRFQYTIRPPCWVLISVSTGRCGSCTREDAAEAPVPSRPSSANITASDRPDLAGGSHAPVPVRDRLRVRGRRHRVCQRDPRARPATRSAHHCLRCVDRAYVPRARRDPGHRHAVRV